METKRNIFRVARTEKEIFISVLVEDIDKIPEGHPLKQILSAGAVLCPDVFDLKVPDFEVKTEEKLTETAAPSPKETKIMDYNGLVEFIKSGAAPTEEVCKLIKETMSSNICHDKDSLLLAFNETSLEAAIKKLNIIFDYAKKNKLESERR